MVAVRESIIAFGQSFEGVFYCVAEMMAVDVEVAVNPPSAFIVSEQSQLHSQDE